MRGDPRAERLAAAADSVPNGEVESALDAEGSVAPDPASTPVAPDPETEPVTFVPDGELEPETESVAPETEPVGADPEGTEMGLVTLPVALVTLPVTFDATVVCEAIVEIADVTVPIGSGVPAIAALVQSPHKRSATKTHTRMTAERIPFDVSRLEDVETAWGRVDSESGNGGLAEE